MAKEAVAARYASDENVAAHLELPGDDRPEPPVGQLNATNHAPGTPAGQPGLDALIAVRDARDAMLRETIAVGEAERVVSSARMAELAATSKAAVRRHRAAKGLLTRARKDGSAQKIAAAAAREREASAEADRILEECQAEMRLIVRAGLDSLGELNDQIGPAWDARAAVTDAIAQARAQRRGQPNSAR